MSGREKKTFLSQPPAKATIETLNTCSGSADKKGVKCTLPLDMCKHRNAGTGATEANELSISGMSFKAHVIYKSSKRDVGFVLSLYLQVTSPIHDRRWVTTPQKALMMKKQL